MHRICNKKNVADVAAEINIDVIDECPDIKYDK